MMMLTKTVQLMLEIVEEAGAIRFRDRCGTRTAVWDREGEARRHHDGRTVGRH